MSNHRPGTLGILRLVLQPVVRFCVRRSLKFQEFVDAARELFIECAHDHLQEQQHEVNASRLSVLTGLHRREIARHLQGEMAPKEKPGTLRKVIGKWSSDSRYLDAGGKPKMLRLKGGDSEFAELVQSVNKSVNPYTVLFELERLGVVEKIDDTIRLKTGTVDLRSDARRGIELLAQDMDTLFNAVNDNLFDESIKAPHHHIATRYDNIVLEALPKIREWFMQEGADFHARARAFLARYDKDLNQKLWKKEGGGHVALCSVSFTQKEAQDESAEK